MVLLRVAGRKVKRIGTFGSVPGLPGNPWQSWASGSYYKGMAAIDVNLGETHCFLDIGERKAFMQIKGHWTGANAIKLGKFFSKAIEGMRGQLVLSLEGCRSLDAQALTMLLRLQEQLETLGKRMELVGVPRALRSMFEGTQLIPHLEAASGTAVLEVR